MKRYQFLRDLLSPKELINFLRNIWSPRIFLFPILSSITTFVCLRFAFAVEMHVVASVFFVGIFFCFGIVMNTADERRFRAFEEISLIKANLMSLWHITLRLDLPEKKRHEISTRLPEILTEIADFLLERDCDSSLEKLFLVDQKLKYLEYIVEIFRENNFPSPELSRLHQWVAQIYFAFEKLLTIKEYRTPLTLRLFLQFSLGLSVFVLAPEFAYLGNYGIVLSAIIAFLLFSLIEIQNLIEYPFSGFFDNIQFEFLKRFEDRIELMPESDFVLFQKCDGSKNQSVCSCYQGAEKRKKE